MSQVQQPFLTLNYEDEELLNYTPSQSIPQNTLPVNHNDNISTINLGSKQNLDKIYSFDSERSTDYYTYTDIPDAILHLLISGNTEANEETPAPLLNGTIKSREKWKWHEQTEKDIADKSICSNSRKRKRMIPGQGYESGPALVQVENSRRKKQRVYDSFMSLLTPISNGDDKENLAIQCVTPVQYNPEL